ncbi:GNAT family N-acetyltransferase [Proteus terrae]|uniref:GNAT family N-acetyltransferase n=1 Tax=Proteus terrae TaxID=1574161 RepID=UPI0013300898|nr:GNAT family N-acetyltransferase [Proteus terrae]QKD71328.1 GNAT family N-acetyltransferase [Proteus terrae subsp. cibarius]QKD74678.1 GNAT family N-acetyltransferase [Proteus terrae subsp. cibarius]UDF27667.1 GNAT family N-acetyltransferase [Proteus terrae subsp. cibarius]WCG88625.1 GNAT family N-acetyltransferase [Proteus terrae]
MTATQAITSNIVIRAIEKKDNAGIARVIREVSAEHGLTADKGFAVADPILDTLYEVYHQPRSAYWVVEMDGEVVGGGGVAPLAGGDGNTCELQKMYLSSKLRGKGIAKKIVLQSLEFGKEQGFSRCYLETTDILKAAVGLYEKLGFEFIDEVLGNTGHSDCEIRMVKPL